MKINPSLLNGLAKTLSSLLLPITLCLVFAMLIIPLPAWMLDACFTLNIALALVVLLAAFQHKRPLEFAVFPSLVLLTTLFRLALNVASTRIVLLNGHEGTDAAGQVIQAFAGIVIGNNTAVGIIVFSILVIVNFVVVTKGANRVSEVSARFTLDALPGKQLAIDAELNQGIISQQEAQLRRQELNEETNFYGAMDGASKFVRGDAVAGILILLINIIGGVVVGTLQHHMDFVQASERYFLLTVGDGLVAQIPALLISTATALIVTRSSTPQDLGVAMYQQVIQQPKNLLIAATVVGMVALFPGMPHWVFLSVAAILGLAAYGMQREARLEPVVATGPTPVPTPAPVSWQDIKVSHGMEIHCGYQLLRELQRNASYLESINAHRRQLSRRFGFLIPGVVIRDNLRLRPFEYQIMINGRQVGTAEVFPQQQLALFESEPTVEGQLIQEPIGGGPAMWVNQQLPNVSAKYIDSVTVFTSHCQHLMVRHLDQLFSYESLSGYLSMIRQTQSELAAQIDASALANSTLLSVFKQLLAEHLSLAAVEPLFETLLAHQQLSADELAECARKPLAEQHLQIIVPSSSTLNIIQLDPDLEQNLLHLISTAELPKEQQQLQQKLSELTKNLALCRQSHEQSSVLVVHRSLRQALAKRLRQHGSHHPVFASDEIPASYHTKLVAKITE